MSDIRNALKTLIARVVEGDGRASHAQRRGAFDRTLAAEPLRTLVGKVAEHADRVTDEDIAAAKAAGHTEDQIFEVVVCAAIGQASREHEAALKALAAAGGS